MCPLPRDFCSMNVCSGAFQTGPCKKQTNESKTHESSADIFLEPLENCLTLNQKLCKMSSAFAVFGPWSVVAMITSPAQAIPGIATPSSKYGRFEEDGLLVVLIPVLNVLPLCTEGDSSDSVMSIYSWSSSTKKSNQFPSIGVIFMKFATSAF